MLAQSRLPLLAASDFKLLAKLELELETSSFAGGPAGAVSPLPADSPGTRPICDAAAASLFFD